MGKGGEGGVELAEEVLRLCEQPSNLEFAYEDNLGLAEKMEAIAKRIYHADGVNFTAAAKKQIAQIEGMGFAHMPVCMAKRSIASPMTLQSLVLLATLLLRFAKLRFRWCRFCSGSYG